MSVEEILPGERILGCLLGMATGDALGAPLEGMKSGRVEQLLGRVDDYVDADAAHPGKPGRWTPTGLHTANTQLALALGDALLLTGEESRDEFVENIERLASRGEGPYGALRGLSSDLRAAIGRLRESESPPRSLAPGPVSWIVPLGIFASTQSEEIDLASLAGSLAGVATSDIRTAASAAVCAEALRRCLAGEWDASDGGVDAAASLTDWAKGAEDRLLENGFRSGDDEAADSVDAVSQTLSVVAPSLKEGNDDLARRSILAEASRHSSERLSADVQAPFAPANIAWALYLALKQRRFDAPVEQALSGGRSASEIAAVIGAIQGARLGPSAIPAPWLSGLIARDLVVHRATAYFEGDIAAIYENDLCQAESAWTRMESEGRAGRFATIQETQKKRDERKQSKKPRTLAARPPTTYARADLPAFDPGPDPEEARKKRAQRGRKRIDWKEDRRKRSRGGE